MNIYFYYCLSRNDDNKYIMLKTYIIIGINYGKHKTTPQGVVLFKYF